jgi:exopolysaccharide production protein ExoZ
VAVAPLGLYTDSIQATITMKSGRLLGIQLARAFAAMLVVLYHASRMISLPQYAGHVGLGGILSFGHSGVDFFFVLSGFIIYYVHNGDLGHPAELRRYIWRRVARIYPDYWLVLTFVVLISVIKHDPSLTPDHFLRSLFLLPDDHEPLLGVSWTLVYEMLFYLVFALGIVDIRLGLVAGVLWIAAIVGGVGQYHEPFLSVFGSIRNLQFLIGIVAARIVLRTRPRFALWLAGAGIVAFLGTGILENVGIVSWDSAGSSIMFGAGAAMAIVGLASAEKQGHLRVGRIGEFLGGASYLLYLVHTIVIGLVFRALTFGGIIHGMPDWIAVILAATCSVAVAGMLYRFIEQPTLGMLNRFGRKHVFATIASADAHTSP